MMTMLHLAAGLILAGAATAAIPAIDQLGNGHRILIVSGPEGDGQVAAQRATLAAWQQGGEERDVAPVILDGASVEGASDTAAAIRARYALSPDGFAAVLVGKDGHVAFRASQPVTAGELERTIDAMPMRRAGQR